jgi:hypothetical protein
MNYNIALNFLSYGLVLGVKVTINNNIFDYESKQNDAEHVFD